jgi:hypothetical protein
VSYLTDDAENGVAFSYKFLTVAALLALLTALAQ